MRYLPSLRLLSWFLAGVLSGPVGSNLIALADEPLDFNRDVRPILSDKCFSCHGQDANQRHADLRLDEAPYGNNRPNKDSTSKVAIVPGQPDQSELIARIDSSDADLVMPPPKSNKHLSTKERELLRRWIAEGARYDKHWSLIPPRKQSVDPAANSVDWFVSKRLQSLGWELSPPAAPETWLRRVSIDLTGLPPTLPDVDNFLQTLSSHGETAYEKEVDRLLASPRFGERMAQEWLDAARYADTHGFNNDSARIMWRWRDWVIDAFNSNLPYDQFITEQLAGDLLPDATLENRIATGFCRNHVINSEGGIIDEEYRVEYVADRVRTMSTAWLGLTMECSRCHDHKFDPISQKDYYSLFAFFNNVPEHGEDGRIANAVPLIAAPTTAQQHALSALTRQHDALTQQVTKLRSELEKQLDLAKVANQLVKSDSEKAPEEATKSTASSVPSNAPNASNAPPAEAGKANGEPQPKVDVRTAVTVPDPSFELDCEVAAAKEKVWKLLGDAPKLEPGVIGQAWRLDSTKATAEIASGQLNFGKRLTVSMWLKPDRENPRDVALLSGVKYDGNPNSSGYGKGCEIRLIDGEIEVRSNDFFPAYSLRVQSRGAAISPDQWHQITVVTGGSRHAKDTHLFVDGRELLTEALYDGATSESTGSNSPYAIGAERSKSSNSYRGVIDQLAGYASELNPTQVHALFVKQALPYARQRFEAGQIASHEREWLVEEGLKQASSNYRDAVTQQTDVWLKQLDLRRSFPSAMVMQELPKPRTTYVLKRGAYDAHGEEVTASVPAWIAPWPEGAPLNRLGLAQWLTSREHPLCARVVVNRLWAQLFGAGIVRTLEDFGFQGEYPSHPELLDWLACEFVESGWNTKSLMRLIVLSKTYRQSGRVTSEQLARDPDNRWMARSPRLRLSAEMLRDQALMLSGLLRERLGGPSVYPYQPEGLYNGLVVGANYPGTEWPLSKGDDLYRRTMYMFIKRTVPHPLMQTFDAPDREFCTVRRSRTNTPLQALLLMNEPAFYESAQQLGRRLQQEGGSSDQSKLRWAFRHVTARQPSAEELTRLEQAWISARQQDPATADTILGSILLNLDETVTRE